MFNLQNIYKYIYNKIWINIFFPLFRLKLGDNRKNKIANENKNYDAQRRHQCKTFLPNLSAIKRSKCVR